jgi:hypothetical protein
MVTHCLINQPSFPRWFWRKPLIFSSTFLGLLSLSIAWNSPARSETCIPLPLVGGQGNSISKTVSQPTIPTIFGVDITRNNWNTDWAVPGDRPFHRFLATIAAPNGGSFDIKMFLKYSDQTTGQFFNQSGVRIEPEQPLVIKAENRPEDEPYQVNLFIGGLNYIGNSYTANVVGCYR